MTDFDRLPEELKSRDQWVVHRAKHKREKFPKAPLKTDGSHASSTDPSTWSSFQSAKLAVNQGHFDGVGFVFTDADPYVGIDIDHCVDDVSGKINMHAAQLVTRLNSYTELSVSGTGIHIIVEGSKPSTSRTRLAQLEIYSSKQYFALTGQAIEIGTPRIEARESELKSLLLSEGFTDSVEKLNTDEESSVPQGIMIEQFMLSSPRLERIWNGAGSSALTPSHYDFHAALESIRSGYSDEQVADVIRALRNRPWQSAMSRLKSLRPDYIERTVQNARQMTVRDKEVERWSDKRSISAKRRLESLDAFTEHQRYMSAEGVSPGARLMLNAMTWYSQNGVTVKVAHRQLARDLNVEFRTITTNIRSLIDHGCITLLKAGSGIRIPEYKVNILDQAHHMAINRQDIKR